MTPALERQNDRLEALLARLAAARNGWDRARTPDARRAALAAERQVFREAAEAGVLDAVEWTANLWTARRYGGPADNSLSVAMRQWQRQAVGRVDDDPPTDDTP